MTRTQRGRTANGAERGRTLLLIRHARDRSATDTRHLSTIGRLQSYVASCVLRRRAYDAVQPIRFLASPEPRAQQTARILFGRKSIITDERLREIRGYRPGPPRTRSASSNELVECWRGFTRRISGFVSEFEAGFGSTVGVTHRGVFDAVLEIVTHAATPAELDPRHLGVLHLEYRPGNKSGAWLLRSCR
ncbi:histidine phosphatase family protein [Pseudonocardia sp. HH130629-09]|uniref:histidine phosphatase family protein n=1 Tax=Pseudonocardia sp. HH130629-09 TaxID=1641402 RepID=UPI0009E9248C